MELDEIRQLIQLMRENRLAEIHIERGDDKIRLVSEPTHSAPHYLPPAADHALHVAPAPAHQLPAPAAPHSPNAAGPPAEEGVTINSPIVGTFYRSPSPESPPYIDVNDNFDADTVLCIVEAMKVMNEIKAETSGTILQVLVENGQPVEFGQPLFLVKPA
jgi:acetyl-CoA carboxylase biotin carboxyl carrier protein